MSAIQHHTTYPLRGVRGVAAPHVAAIKGLQPLRLQPVCRSLSSSVPNGHQQRWPDGLISPDTPAEASTVVESLDLRKCVTAVCATAICYTLLAGCKPAHASEREWKPRRHYRRLGERWSNSWAMELVEEQEGAHEQEAVSRKRQQQLLLEQEAAEAAKRREEEAARRKKAEAILAQQAKARGQDSNLPFSVRVGGTDLAPFIVWAGMGVLAYATLKGTVAGVNRMRKGRGEGKWVYDRSLGGKKVWVPAEGSGSPSSNGKPSLSERELSQLTSIAAAAATASRSPSPGSVEPPRLPAWWSPLPRIAADSSLAAARQQDAERLLSRMEAGRNRGDDFTLDDIIRLRELCQEGGAVVSARTVGARDALFRAAVDAAVTIAMDPAEAASSDALTAIADGPPIRFLASLATDISLPPEKAVAVMCAAVAAAARARLVDALAGIKEDLATGGGAAPAGAVNEGEMAAVMSLVRLCSLVAKLPVLVQSSTEVALIAESLERTFSVEERRRAFFLLGQLYPEAAALAACLLGFDPAAVVPQLMDDLEEYRRQYEAAAQQGVSA